MVIFSSTRPVVVTRIADIAISTEAARVVVVFRSARAVVIATGHKSTLQSKL
jgi:hypothetical protein